MRWLVIGTGQTGRRVIQCAQQRHEVIGTFHRQRPTPDLGTVYQLDKTRSDAVRALLDAVKPDVVVDTATPRGIKYIETHPEETRAVNILGTGYLLEACRRLDAMFVFISTDHVFDGSRGCYTEAEEAKPISLYGRTKLEAERVIASSGVRHLILRPSMIYSWDLEFLRRDESGWSNPSFAMWLIGKLFKGAPVDVVEDQFSSPTLADHLAEMIVDGVEGGHEGLYHTAGATRVSRYEFARQLAQPLGFDPGLITPARSADIGALANSPGDTSLDVTKASQALTVKPLTLDKAIERFCRQAEGAGLNDMRAAR